ncbi:MAG: Uma2 family endonuclease [Chloroflexi bacterium]|nr:MAG: Uma2 family endonuclease [Chloroflexota bacterium]
MTVLTASAPVEVKENEQMPPQGEWTYADYLRLPDDGWQYEVIYGRLLMNPAPSPTHQRIISELLTAIKIFLRQHPVGEVFPAPTDVVIPGKAEPVQPDLVFVAAERMDIVTQRAIEGVPDLTVEVLSPTNWLDDRRTKFALYAEIGVREYWIVDPDQRTVEVFSLQEGRYALVDRYGSDDTLRSDILPGFEVAVASFFPT